MLLLELVRDDGSAFFFCGGTLIAPNVVLTAAHCYDYRTANDQVRVVLGEHDRTDSNIGKPIMVKSILTHPNYDIIENNNDIMLLQLEKDAEGFESIKLNDGSIIIDNMKAIGAGWGFTQEDGEPSDVLLQIDLDVYEKSECVWYIEKIFHGDSYGKNCSIGNKGDTCNGDSGGPVFFANDDDTYTQIGIVSMGKGCTNNAHPGINTDIATYYLWIIDEVCLGKEALSSSSSLCESLNHPTVQPSNEIFSVKPTPTPSLQAEYCEDVPGWYDSYYELCIHYTQEDYCEDYGDSFAGLYDLTANEACCGKVKRQISCRKLDIAKSLTKLICDTLFIVCGGSIDAMPPRPSAIPSISVSPTVFCEDVPGWFDKDNDTCIEYSELHWCNYYGGSYAGLYDLTANEACCGKIEVVIFYRNTHNITSLLLCYFI